MIVTDPFVLGEPPNEKVIFFRDHGSRAYYCGEENGQPKLIWGISDTVKFDSREAAEARVLILCIWCPELIDHAHILTEEGAQAQWDMDLDKFKKKLESQGESRDNSGCF